MTKLAKKDIEKIPKLREAGLTAQEIGDKLGVSKPTIHYWEKRLRAIGWQLIIRKGRPPIIT